MRKSRPAAGASRKIVIENGTSFNATTHWWMAGLLLCGALAAQIYLAPTLVLDLDSPEFDPVAFLPIVLGLLGLGYLAMAARDTLVARKFGATVLEIDGDGVEPGGTLTGLIRCATGVAPAGEYVINLQCIESQLSTASIDRRRNVDHLRWEATRRLDPKSVDARAGIPVQFDLPASAPATGEPGLKGAVRWVMDVKAPLPGTDFYAIFVIPVRPRPSR